jgi:hypothetical protein
MQDNLSHTSKIETRDTALLAELIKTADSYALTLDIKLSSECLGYVLFDQWTGATDCGPTDLTEIAVHLSHYRAWTKRFSVAMSKAHNH